MHAQQDSDRYWILKSLYSLNETQNSFGNWNAGARKNISLITSFGAKALDIKRNMKWSSNF